MSGHLADVFETMLSMKTTLLVENDLPRFADRVSGSVGFAGEKVTGAVYLHLSAPFALHVAAAMLGLAVDELGEAEANDVVGEATNMLAGGLKSWLCDKGAACALSTPSIIRGLAYGIEPAANVQREILVFGCDADRVIVEVHFKFA